MPNTQEAKAGVLFQVQGLPGLHSKFYDSLIYRVRFCFKKINNLYLLISSLMSMNNNFISSAIDFKAYRELWTVTRNTQISTQLQRYYLHSLLQLQAKNTQKRNMCMKPDIHLYRKNVKNTATKRHLILCTSFTKQNKCEDLLRTLAALTEDPVLIPSHL